MHFLAPRPVFIAVTALFAVALLLAYGANLVAAPPSASERMVARNGGSSSRDVFERRIRPLLTAKNPSSCAECHLSGVDLKDYIRPTEAETFAALRQQGMLDLKRVDNSRILHFIRMSRPQTPLVTQKVRSAEYEAFRDWIVAAAKNTKLASSSSVKKKGQQNQSSQRVGPAVSDAVIRHTRLDSVLASFERNVWSQEGRCMGCHRPDNKENIKKHGERVAWFVPDDPEATMKRLIAQGAVNVEKPEESLLLLKPLNKVPHGGGVKMLYGDGGYKMFRAWLEDYAKSAKGKYRREQDLPAKPAYALVNMNSILNVTGAPPMWANRLLRVDVYPFDAAQNDWATRPVATGDRMIHAGSGTEGGSTNIVLFRIVPSKAGNSKSVGAAAAADALSPLPAGRYRVKMYCDTTGRLEKDHTIPTDLPEFYQGAQEVNAEWGKGWGGLVKLDVAKAALTPSPVPAP